MTWQSNKLFKNLTDDETAEISRTARHMTVDAGGYLFHEGDEASDLFILETGLVEIVKVDKKTKNEAVLNKLKSGDVIGDVALVDRGRRSASVRVAESCNLLALPFDALRGSHADDTSESAKHLRNAYVKMLQNLAEGLSARLRSADNEALKQAVDRVNMGLFVMATIGLLAMYILLLGLLPQIGTHVAETSFVSIPLLGIFGLTSLYFVRRSGLPLEVFGLTTKNRGKAIAEGVLFSLPILAGLMLAKWIYLQMDPARAAQPVLEWRSVLKHYGVGGEIGFAGVYALFTFVQEFIARSGLQAPLERFLVSKHRATLAILLSNLLFAMTHMHVSGQLALMVFFIGCFWGWMFKRHGSLFGCTVNHMIIGTFIFFVLGM